MRLGHIWLTLLAAPNRRDPALAEVGEGLRLQPCAVCARLIRPLVLFLQRAVTAGVDMIIMVIMVITIIIIVQQQLRGLFFLE